MSYYNYYSILWVSHWTNLSEGNAVHLLVQLVPENVGRILGRFIIHKLSPCPSVLFSRVVFKTIQLVQKFDLVDFLFLLNLLWLGAALKSSFDHLLLPPDDDDDDDDDDGSCLMSVFISPICSSSPVISVISCSRTLVNGHNEDDDGVEERWQRQQWWR